MKTVKKAIQTNMNCNENVRSTNKYTYMYNVYVMCIYLYTLVYKCNVFPIHFVYCCKNMFFSTTQFWLYVRQQQRSINKKKQHLRCLLKRSKQSRRGRE